MVPFYKLMAVSREEIIDRHSNIWPRLRPDCAGGQVTSLAIETAMAEKIRGLGESLSFPYFLLISTHITGDSISFGRYKYVPQYRKHYTEVNPKPS